MEAGGVCVTFIFHHSKQVDRSQHYRTHTTLACVWQHQPATERAQSSYSTALPNTCTDRPCVPSIASQVFMAITAGRGG